MVFQEVSVRFLLEAGTIHLHSQRSGLWCGRAFDMGATFGPLIWERAKVGNFFLFMDIISIMSIIRIVLYCHIGTTSYRAHFGWRRRTFLYFLICRTNSRGFCMSFMLFGLKAQTFRPCPQTDVHGALKNEQVQYMQHVTHWFVCKGCYISCYYMYYITYAYYIYYVLLYQ